MTPEQLFFIMRARYRLIVWGALAGLLVGVAWMVAVKRVYRATAQVVISVRTPEGTDEAANIQPLLAPDYLTTQMDIIRSGRVAARAGQILGVLKDPVALRRPEGSGSADTTSDYSARQLQTGLSVESSGSSRVILIGYTAGRPVEAARVANAIATAYQDVSLDLQVEPARKSLLWYERNGDAVRAQLAEAQRQLAERQQSLNITADTDQTDPEIARLIALSQSLATAQAQEAIVASRSGAGARPDALASPVVQQLQTDLARLKAQRELLATRAGPNNDQMREIQGQIATLQQQLQGQRSEVLQSARAASSQAATNVAYLSQQFAAQKERALKARSARADIAALQQRVTTLQKAYEDLVARQSQARLLGSGEQTNVTLLSPASPPAVAAGLPRTLKVVLALLLGSALGAGLALIIELLDQRIHATEDFMAWVGIPNLGSVRVFPEPGRKLLGQSRRYLLPSSRQSDR